MRRFEDEYIHDVRVDIAQDLNDYYEEFPGFGKVQHCGMIRLIMTLLFDGEDDEKFK